jgi:hypothetical protein
MKRLRLRAPTKASTPSTSSSGNTTCVRISVTLLSPTHSSALLPNCQTNSSRSC